MGSPKFTLRSAMAGDMGRVRALLGESELPTEDIAGRLDKDFVVAELGGEVIGVAGLEINGRYGLLRSVAVAPTHRGHGVGESLVAERLERARRGAADEVYLLTTTAGRYFERLGFRPVSRDTVPAEIKATTEYSSLCPASAEVLVLAMTERAGETGKRVPGECCRGVNP